jgi:hypothetical protein
MCSIPPSRPSTIQARIVHSRGTGPSLSANDASRQVLTIDADHPAPRSRNGTTLDGVAMAPSVPSITTYDLDTLTLPTSSAVQESRPPSLAAHGHKLDPSEQSNSLKDVGGLGEHLPLGDSNIDVEDEGDEEEPNAGGCLLTLLLPDET